EGAAVIVLVAAPHKGANNAVFLDALFPSKKRACDLSGGNVRGHDDIAEHSQSPTNILRNQGFERSGHLGGSIVEERQIDTEQERAELGCRIFDLISRRERVLLALGDFTLEILQNKFQPLSNDRRKSRRSNIEVDRVYESVKGRLVAMSFESGIAQIDE